MNKEWIRKCIPAPVLIHKPSVRCQRRYRAFHF